MSATTSSELTPPAITEALPRPIPYVCGYVFTEEQARLFAEQVLPAEELTMARKDGGYQKRLVFYYRKQKILQTFLPFFTDDKALRYLWVRGVMPSYTGTTPEFSYDKEKLMAALKQYGPEFDTAWIHCVKWPEAFCRPDWLIPMMNGQIRKLKEEAKRKRTELVE